MTQVDLIYDTDCVERMAQKDRGCRLLPRMRSAGTGNRNIERLRKKVIK